MEQQEQPKEQQEMTKEQAAKVIDQALAMMKLSRQDHAILLHALKILAQ